MNGSRSARSTPAKARRTGKPSPSNPRGADVTPRTGRWRASVGSGSAIRGRTVMSSTTTAGMGRGAPLPATQDSMTLVDYATVSVLASPRREPTRECDMSDFNKNLIADMRAHGGHATSGPFVGRQVLILTTTG